MNSESNDVPPIREAQGLCTGCGDRYQFIAQSETKAGMTVETNEYCQCDEPHENVVTVVYHPDHYDLVDNLGDGEITLRAQCEECGEKYYGPMRKPCYYCGCEEFERWVVVDE